MKKRLNAAVTFKKYILIIILFFFQGLAWAQDKKVDVNLNVNDGASNWYTQPWVWVVGAAVFIIILVAILRGGGRKA